ncbi:MAG TPA: PilZ domain-containing protein [Nitrospiraceae bacterium]|nr:PilZ domain-containing protein [Nitrospiraceae bacterium]
MDLRKFRRANVEYPVSFSGDGLSGKGMTCNLTTQGCGIRSDTPVTQGAYLTLHIHLPESPTPLLIEMAAVRWARTTEFGANFVSMPEAERERLRRTLGALERTAAGLPPDRPA